MPPRYFASHQQAPVEEKLEIEFQAPPAVVERAFANTDYHGVPARDFFRASLEEAGAKGSDPQVIGKPPADLPALLRLADSLDALAQREAGEVARVWACEKCGTRYAVPRALVRTVQIKCERCGKNVELNPDNSLGEQSLVDPFGESVNVLRRKVAAFFREAMARSWPVAVTKN